MYTWALPVCSFPAKYTFFLWFLVIVTDKLSYLLVPTYARRQLVAIEACHQDSF